MASFLIFNTIKWFLKKKKNTPPLAAANFSSNNRSVDLQNKLAICQSILQR